MAMTEFIAAVELSSTRISGIAGKKNEDGTLQVLAYAQEEATSYMRKGLVYNIDKTSQSLIDIIKNLEETLDSKIAKVYVGISGQLVHTIKSVINRSLGKIEIISQSLIDSISDENIGLPVDNKVILEVVPQEFKIRDNFQKDPVGVASDHIEGHYLNIVAREDARKNLLHSFEKANIEIADLLVSPLAAAKLLVPEADKRAGCAFVDFGAETTTVAIYKNEILRFLTVIPLGANNITKDLASLKIEESRAEYLKLRLADLNYKDEDEEVIETFFLDEEKTREISIFKVNEMIHARAEEIIANVWNQIQLSGYDDQLLAGFVITGGGANLVGLKELIRKITRIERIKLAKPCIDIIHSKRIAEIKEKAAPHSLNTVLGLLAASEMNCAKIEAPTTGKIFEAENLIEDQETTKQDLPETKTPEQLLAEQKLIQEQEEAKKKAEKEKLEKLELQKAKEKDLEQERSKKKKKKSWKQSLFSTFEDLQKNIFDENDELK